MLDAERGEVHAVEAVGLAADPRGEEVAVEGSAEGDQRGGVAGEVEVELAVGQVARRAGQPSGLCEPALVGRVIEGGVGAGFSSRPGSIASGSG